MTLNRHSIGAFVYTAIIVLNHRLKFELDAIELCILAAVLGLDQVVALVRAIKMAPNQPEPAPEPAKTSTTVTVEVPNAP